MNEKFSIKIIDVLKNFKFWVLIFFILISFLTINYALGDNEGIAINGVGIGSAAEKAGVSVNSQASLRSYERIISVDGKLVFSEKEFYDIVDSFDFNESFKLITDKNPLGYKITLQQESNKTIQQVLGLSVRPVAKSNVKLGIELEGGSRLILKPITTITDDEFDLLVTSLQNRLDVYGASGTKVNRLDDSFTGEKFIIVESTSSNKNDIYDLISRQGKFTAMIGDVTVFTGENVLHVFTDPQRAGLEQCSNTQDGIVCTYRFQIEIDSAGGDKFFEETQKLSVVGDHLSEKVTFALDGRNITSLNVASSFKYQKITNPQITVSGSAFSTQEKAIESGKKEMKLLQTILSTQSLPSELEVVQSYSISSSMGTRLLDNAAFVGLVAVLLVSLIVALRYRHPWIFVGIFIALIGEVIIVFGVAAFLKLTIDLSAIGGLIASIGTGVDDQIIITDEYFRKRKNVMSSRLKIKNAILIIMIAYATTVAAMFPLMFAGLKMVQGFAFMILIGVTVGVFITRPAYAAMLRIFMTTREQRKEEEDSE